MEEEANNPDDYAVEVPATQGGTLIPLYLPPRKLFSKTWTIWRRYILMFVAN